MDTALLEARHGTSTAVGTRQSLDWYPRPKERTMCEGSMKYYTTTTTTLFVRRGGYNGVDE